MCVRAELKTHQVRLPLKAETFTLSVMMGYPSSVCLMTDKGKAKNQGTIYEYHIYSLFKMLNADTAYGVVQSFISTQVKE